MIGDRDGDHPEDEISSSTLIPEADVVCRKRPQRPA
jgi:hypothetical protein